MQLSEVLAIKSEADRGRWFQLLHPVTGANTGLALLVAGPDSDRQARAQAQMVDDLSEVADPQSGRVSGDDRAACHLALLARCVIDWRVTEEGQAVPFTEKALLRLLSVAWVRMQVDAFAGARGLYFDTPAPTLNDLGAVDAKA